MGLAIAIMVSTAALSPATPPAECSGESTVDMNICLKWKMDTADARLEQYLEAARGADSDAQDVARGLAASQRDFSAYRKAECTTLYDSFGSGSFRGIAFGNCYLMLTNQRTLALWTNWLQPIGDGEPPLPRPEPID